MKDQQPVKENAENFTSGENVLKKPAVSLHETAVKEAVAELSEGLGLAVDVDGFSQDYLTVSRRDVETVLAALHTVEGNYQKEREDRQWLATHFCSIQRLTPTTWVWSPLLQFVARSYDSLDALVTAERERA